ncbi:MAG: hypothetical protein IAX21_00430 [Candidatus Bathyarchaeota archaeon]|nr:hypothetical protein [Candidatus Bathyarchaeum tardum]WGM90553.1 MAG: hypothetical protein NUK63_05375 [Candidatus Bathyarchaeum tardum]WNZ29373.1 MAG: hypothetical protein IAX21_00430 [Candidatus Bathyarchaeota archaeon]
MGDISVSEELNKKIKRLTETLEISTEELLSSSIEAFINQRCDTEKKVKTETKFPKTKYTPSKKS